LAHGLLLTLAIRAGAGVVPGLDVADLAEELAVAVEAGDRGSDPLLSLRRSETELIFELGLEPMPTPLNYQCMGSHYRRCIEALFEQGTEAALHVVRQRWEMTGETDASDPSATKEGTK
jgi:hypothetical protein